MGTPCHMTKMSCNPLNGNELWRQHLLYDVMGLVLPYQVHLGFVSIRALYTCQRKQRAPSKSDS